MVLFCLFTVDVSREDERRIMQPVVKIVRPMLELSPAWAIPDGFWVVVSVFGLGVCAVQGFRAYHARNQGARRDMVEVNRILRQVQNGMGLVVVYDQDTKKFRIQYIRARGQEAPRFDFLNR